MQRPEKTKRVDPTKLYGSARQRSRVTTQLLEALSLRDVLGRKATGTERSICRGSDDAIVIPMLDSDGHISNVMKLDAHGDLTGLPGVPVTGTLIGSPCEITSRTDAVLVVGAVESLTAALAYPNAVILGARDAQHFAQLAPSVTRRTKLAGSCLRLIVDDTDAGETVAIDAARAAMALDLPLHHRVFVVDTGHATLSEAWRSGWRATR